MCTGRAWDDVPDTVNGHVSCDGALNDDTQLKNAETHNLFSTLSHPVRPAAVIDPSDSSLNVCSVRHPLARAHGMQPRIQNTGRLARGSHGERCSRT